MEGRKRKKGRKKGRREVLPLPYKRPGGAQRSTTQGNSDLVSSVGGKKYVRNK